jgi:hypothetical protein
MKYKLKNNKGAIEMSLNLIIMLIIGMVVLGLVISFVNSLVNKGTEGYDKQLGDNEKLKLEEVKNSDENLAVSPSPSLTVKKGDKVNIFIKVRAFAEDIDCNPGDLRNCDKVIYIIQDENGEKISDSFILTGPGFLATNGNEDAKMYTLKPSSDVAIGTYYLSIILYPETNNQVKETITVEVK